MALADRPADLSLILRIGAFRLVLQDFASLGIDADSAPPPTLANIERVAQAAASTLVLQFLLHDLAGIALQRDVSRLLHREICFFEYARLGSIGRQRLDRQCNRLAPPLATGWPTRPGSAMKVERSSSALASPCLPPPIVGPTFRGSSYSGPRSFSPGRPAPRSATYWTSRSIYTGLHFPFA